MAGETAVNNAAMAAAGNPRYGINQKCAATSSTPIAAGTARSASSLRSA